MKLSACIIAKNEEGQLPRCLKSISDFCDEIIIVDTGSTDKTVQIAESFSAKVYHHKWQDDFSLHRNQAFNYATGDWYFVIDCDEEVINFDVKPDMFKNRLARVKTDISTLAVTVFENIDGTRTSWPGKRFFRASAKPRYEGCVHNRVHLDGWCAGTDIMIEHHGYHLSVEKMEKKRQRTLRLLQKRLKENPDDANAYYYMCQMAASRKDHDETIKYGKKSFGLLTLKPKELQFYAVIYVWVGQAYFIKAAEERKRSKRQYYLDQCYSWLIKGLEANPGDLDLNFLMAQLYYNCQEYEKMLPFCKQYLETLEDLKNNKQYEGDAFENRLNMENFNTRTLYFLGEVHEKVIRRWMIKN